MSGIFGAPSFSASPLPEPKSKRAPVETDPDIIAAGQRTRQAALKRKGRLSTIMTDGVGSAIGSSGKSLGA